mgnify:CR=1 FL=1
MAHAFKIMDSTNTITTYTDYDSIPLDTLKHVISFLPDVGTEVSANEILLEIETLDSGTTDKILGEDGTIDENDVEIDFNLVLDGTDASSINAGDNLIYEFAEGRHKLVPEDFATGSENHLMLEDTDVLLLDSTDSSRVIIEAGGTDGGGTNAGDNIVLNGTDSSSTNADDTISMEIVSDEGGLIISESSFGGEEREAFIISEENVTDHFHPPITEPHTDEDGHTAEEHRELDLWNYKLDLLIIQEDANNL